MPLAQAMWTHGHAVRIETPDHLSAVWRSGTFVRIVGKQAQSAWLHYSIPTPVIVTDRRLTAGSVMIRSRTVPQNDAWIEAVHVYDGENRIAAHDGRHDNSRDWSFLRYEVPGTPEVRWGVGVSIKVKFTDLVYTERPISEDVIRNSRIGVSGIEFRVRGLAGRGGTVEPVTHREGARAPEPPREPTLHYAIEISSVGCDFLS